MQRFLLICTLLLCWAWPVFAQEDSGALLPVPGAAPLQEQPLEDQSEAASEFTPGTNGDPTTVNGVSGENPAPRPGTPSFMQAVDTTLQLWSGQLQKLGIYIVALIALLSAYLLGRVLFETLFAAGSFGPRAAGVAAWVASFILLLFIVLMLPREWPWWAPYAALFSGLLVIALLVPTLSKKTI